MNGRYGFRRGIAFSAALVLSLALSACSVHIKEHRGPTTTAPAPSAYMPDVGGLALQEAKRELRHAGFRLGRVEERPSRGTRPGTVVRQYPEPHTAARAGASVDLVVAVTETARPPARAGAKLIEVPDLRGRSLNMARVKLRHRGLRVGTVTEVVTRVEDNGDVVDQSPDYGVHLRRNDSVDLVIARAPKRGEGTPVPDLIGRDLEQAKKVLGWAGLRLGAVRQKDSEDHVPGMVLRQDPAPSSRVENGERVDIVVARTPEKPRHRTEVPNLRGLGVKAAKRALRRADLRLGEVRERWVDHGARDGRVIGQYPEPSSRMRPGERVDIVVARRAEDERARSTTVPSVIGLPLERARRELTQAGLRLGRVTEDITENTWGETIIAQRPAAFWDVATGTVVDVVVARAPKPEAKRRLRTVPPLAGLSVAEADQRLRHAGLRLGRTTFARQGGEVYQIIDQSPAAGAQVKARTKVAVVVVEPRD